MGHIWLRQGEESSQCPSIETLLNYLDPIILANMSDRGYNPCEICEPLLEDLICNGYITHAEKACMPGD
jgi:hypothetical protein